MGRVHETALASTSATAIDPWKLGRAAAPALLVGLGYYAGCLAGFALRFPQSGISFFWPPTAVLTVALLLMRQQDWPGLLMSALVAHAIAHAMDGVPPQVWLIQFSGNGIQAIVAAVCVNRRPRIDALFSDVRSVLIFVAGACVLAPAVASLIPAGAYVQLGWAPDFADAWLARAITNGVASITLIPPLFAVSRFVLFTNRTLPARWKEFVLLVVCIGGVHIATAYLAAAGVLGLSVALYAPLPFLLVVAVRCGAPALTVALLWTTLLTVGTAASGRGPFVVGPSADAVLGAQVSLGANAVLMLLIAGLLEEQRAERARLIAASDQNSAVMTLLRETQQRYEIATAVGGVGVWEWNLRSGELRVEGNLKEVLGYRDDEIQDQRAAWLRQVDLVDRPTVQARLDALVSGTADSFEAEFRLIQRDGSTRWIASKAAVVERRDGARIHAAGTYADITERKESERALRDATDALARTSRISAVAELSASLAHELNQPLTAIVANVTACLGWIESGTSTADLRRALSDVLQEARTASQIVDRTRDMFANQPSESGPLDVNDLVKDIVDIARPRLRELQIALDLRLSDSAPLVIADAVQLRQVILNLVVNAADAMRDTSSQRVLSISSRHSRNVAVSVRDTGRGFSQAEQRKLFEPFYTTKPGGLGMGLAISRSIMRSHHGSLHALMNVGDGATFRLKMPAAEPPVARRRSTSTHRVLLVDDHEGLRTSLARLLQPSGHAIAEAATGAEALAVAESFKPNYAIVDVSLSDMSGLDVAKHLRARSAGLRLFALTAHRDADLRKACLAAGFNAYLVKPHGINRIQKLLG